MFKLTVQNLKTILTVQAIFRLPCSPFSKQVVMQNLSCENEFDLHANEHVGETHFRNIKGFAQRLVFTQRQKVTLKWPLKYKFISVALL